MYYSISSAPQLFLFYFIKELLQSLSQVMSEIIAHGIEDLIPHMEYFWLFDLGVGGLNKSLKLSYNSLGQAH